MERSYWIKKINLNFNFLYKFFIYLIVEIKLIYQAKIIRYGINTRY